MPKRYGNKKHHAYILSLACICSNHECNGLIQGHHLMKPFDGVRGIGLKSNDKNLVLAANGEIYNHVELRSKLNSKHDF